MHLSGACEGARGRDRIRRLSVDRRLTKFLKSRLFFRLSGSMGSFEIESTRVRRNAKRPFRREDGSCTHLPNDSLASYKRACSSSCSRNPTLVDDVLRNSDPNGRPQARPPTRKGHLLGHDLLHHSLPCCPPQYAQHHQHDSPPRERRRRKGLCERGSRGERRGCSKGGRDGRGVSAEGREGGQVPVWPQAHPRLVSLLTLP